MKFSNRTHYKMKPKLLHLLLSLILTLSMIASGAKGVGVRQCRGQSGAEQERSRRNADVVKRQHDLAISPKGRVRVVLPRTYVFCVTHPPTLYLSAFLPTQTILNSLCLCYNLCPFKNFFNFPRIPSFL